MNLRQAKQNLRNKPHQAHKMQQVIEQLAKQRGIMIYELGAHFRIENEPYMRLSVENIGNNQIAVGHSYVHPSGDLVYDPEIVYQVVENIWFPVQTTMYPFWHRYNCLFFEMKDGEYTRAYRWNKHMQQDAARFSDTWATNLVEQGFLKAGKTVPLCVPRLPLHSHEETSINVNVELLERCVNLLDGMWFNPLTQGYINRLRNLRSLPGNMDLKTAQAIYDYWMMKGD